MPTKSKTTALDGYQFELLIVRTKYAETGPYAVVTVKEITSHTDRAEGNHALIPLSEAVDDHGEAG